MSKSSENIDKVRDICVICNEGDNLSRPQDERSWQTLCDAAKIREFEPILNLLRNPATLYTKVFYHRKCRASFTSKTNLAIVEKEKASPSQGEGTSSDLNLRRSSRQFAYFVKKLISI